MDFFDPNLKLKVPGLHNRLNAAAAIAAARQEKITVDESTKAVSEFAGTWRRFEFKGEFQGAYVYDDYAHHPTEIQATIGGVRELYPDKRLTIIFEPHTFSRTASLFDDFAKTFSFADRVMLLPIYAAREDNPTGITSRELAVKSLEFNPNVSFVPTYEEVIEILKNTISSDDVVVVLGAGTITTLAGELVAK
jgi:UDP-N-acetylmuramate--alanine ligase